MILQPTAQQKEDLLKKILDSNEFHDSKKYQELLKYLVEKTEKVSSLKETEIAHDVYGKDSKFDPSTDPIIRSYVSNLRKKLEHYFLTTSDECLFTLEIPKGQYLVKYVPKAAIPKSYLKKINIHALYISIIFIVFVTFLSIYIFSSRPNSANENNLLGNPIWKEFFNNDKIPTLVVVGDYIVLAEKGKRTGRNFLRVPGINNTKELTDSLNEFPSKFKNLEISEVTYIGAGAGLGLSQLFNFFSQNNLKVNTKLSREVTWDDIEKNNIIFIGSLKTLYKLDSLLARTNIKYQLNPNSLTIKDAKTKHEKFFNINWHGGNYERNYGLIVKQSISKENNFILLTGFSEVGVMDAVKNILDPDFMTKIEKLSGSKLPENIPQFEFITEAEGLRYNVLRSKVKHFSLSLD